MLPLRVKNFFDDLIKSIIKSESGFDERAGARESDPRQLVTSLYSKEEADSFMEKIKKLLPGTNANIEVCQSRGNSNLYRVVIFNSEVIYRDIQRVFADLLMIFKPIVDKKGNLITFNNQLFRWELVDGEIFCQGPDFLYSQGAQKDKEKRQAYKDLKYAIENMNVAGIKFSFGAHPNKEVNSLSAEGCTIDTIPFETYRKYLYEYQIKFFNQLTEHYQKITLSQDQDKFMETNDFDGIQSGRIKKEAKAKSLQSFLKNIWRGDKEDKIKMIFEQHLQCYRVIIPEPLDLIQSSMVFTENYLRKQLLNTFGRFKVLPTSIITSTLAKQLDSKIFKNQRDYHYSSTQNLYIIWSIAVDIILKPKVPPLTELVLSFWKKAPPEGIKEGILPVELENCCKEQGVTIVPDTNKMHY